MAIKLTQTDQERIFFCTFTCVDWLPLFEITNVYDELYKWFNIIISNQHQLCGFVIMPNNAHLLVYVSNGEQTINKILANGKRFLAYEIVKRLQDMKRLDILLILSNKVTPLERDRKKKHRVFEVSSDVKVCYSEKFLLQKLAYIHFNPVRGNWKLVDSFENYVHSSAGFYQLNQPHKKVAITHWKDAGNLSSPHGNVSSPLGDDT